MSQQKDCSGFHCSFQHIKKENKSLYRNNEFIEIMSNQSYCGFLKVEAAPSHSAPGSISAFERQKSKL